MIECEWCSRAAICGVAGVWTQLDFMTVYACSEHWPTAIKWIEKQTFDGLEVQEIAVQVFHPFEAE